MTEIGVRVGVRVAVAVGVGVGSGAKRSEKAISEAGSGEMDRDVEAARYGLHKEISVADKVEGAVLHGKVREAKDAVGAGRDNLVLYAVVDDYGDPCQRAFAGVVGIAIPIEVGVRDAGDRSSFGEDRHPVFRRRAFGVVRSGGEDLE